MTTPDDLPGEAYAAALVDLPGMGPATLVALLRENPPEQSWRRILLGELRRPPRNAGIGPTATPATWAEVAARRDVVRRWAATEAAGIRVAYLGGPGFPESLLVDPDPPGVLFWLGDLSALARPCVAIIGTRQCTAYGRSVAIELGRDLAECGVCVVSGLALGIDGAAHHGVLMAGRGGRPVGVAASGVDVPYPRQHADLWRRVAESGAVVSETPPGQAAQSWRFPARNRIIAGLARVVVVVESHAGGGSMLTVGAAADRGIEVLAVPGPVNSAASVGTNQLIYEGLGPVRHAGDVLAALGDLRPWPPPGRAAVRPPSPGRPGRPGPTGDHRGVASAPFAAASAERFDGLGPSEAALLGTPSVALEAPERRVLGSIDRTSTSTGVIANRTGLPIGMLSIVLLRLEALGLVRGAGTWWERCDEE